MRVQHWRFDYGWSYIPEILRKIPGKDRDFDECLVGWHCWAYEGDDENISKWMKENMNGEYECDFRFNSGDPMHTIFIKDDEDATLFKLRWM